MVGDRHDGQEPVIANKREVLWGGKDCIAQLVPVRDAHFVVRSGVRVGNPYVRLYNPEVIKAPSVSAFLHGPTVSCLRRLLKARMPITCSVEVARSIFPSGKKCVSIDYRYIELQPPNPTVRVKIWSETIHDGMTAVGDEFLRLTDIGAVLIVERVAAKQEAA